MRQFLTAIMLFSLAIGAFADNTNRKPEPYVSSPGFAQRNTITVEYLFGVAGMVMEGGGIGFGYERVHVPWFASRYVFSFGIGGSGEAHGTTSLVSVGLGAVFYPEARAPKRLLFRVEANLLYMGVAGEDLYGGLEAHYLIPTTTLAAGWRFNIGRKRVVVSIQPEIAYTLVFPGYVASGPAGNLEEGTTGLYAGMFHPNLILGIGF